MYYRDVTVRSVMQGAVILGTIFILEVDGKEGSWRKMCRTQRRFWGNEE
jgi:hypothetical protein